MARKKESNAKKITAKVQVNSIKNKTSRNEETMNSIINTSIILMSTMMGAFSQVMVSAVGGMASGMAEAMGGKDAEEKITEEFKQKGPEVDEKMKELICDIRKDIYSQMEQKMPESEPLLSNPIFEKGPKIVEKYDFKLPKLTQQLDDNTLAQYSQLLACGDVCFGKLFKELTEWINSLPNFKK